MVEEARCTNDDLFVVDIKMTSKRFLKIDSTNRRWIRKFKARNQYFDKIPKDGTPRLEKTLNGVK